MSLARLDTLLNGMGLGNIGKASTALLTEIRGYGYTGNQSRKQVREWLTRHIQYIQNHPELMPPPPPLIGLPPLPPPPPQPTPPAMISRPPATPPIPTKYVNSPEYKQHQDELEMRKYREE
jgi:hypothetical protein